MKKKSTRRRWNQKAAPVLPKPIPEDVLVKKARHLPLFGPGIVIPKVPLNLLPSYMELYQLRPMSPREIQDLVGQGIRKPDGVLWVKRVPKEEQPHA